MCKTLVALCAVFAAVAFALVTAGTDESDDIDIIMSDMPLKKVQAEEWQANDNGVVYILIGIETCNGNPI